MAHFIKSLKRFLTKSSCGCKKNKQTRKRKRKQARMRKQTRMRRSKQYKGGYIVPSKAVTGSKRPSMSSKQPFKKGWVKTSVKILS